MVNLVEDWEILESHAKDSRAQGYYQILGDAEAAEIRVAIGRLGFTKAFESKKDPLLNHIKAFCESQEFIRVSKSIRDDFFFK